MKKSFFSVFLVAFLLMLTFSKQAFAEEINVVDYSLRPKNNHVRFLTKEEISFKLVDYRFSPLLGITPAVGIVSNPSIGMSKKAVSSEGWLKELASQDTFNSVATPDYSLRLDLEKIPFLPSLGLHSADGKSSLQAAGWLNTFALQLSYGKGSTTSFVWHNQEAQFNWTIKF